MTNPMRFEIVTDANGVHVRYRDEKNHEIVYWTESYRDMRAARRAILLAKKYMRTAPVVDLTKRFRRAA